MQTSEQKLQIEVIKFGSYDLYLLSKAVITWTNIVDSTHFLWIVGHKPKYNMLWCCEMLGVSDPTLMSISNCDRGFREENLFQMWIRSLFLYLEVHHPNIQMKSGCWQKDRPNRSWERKKSQTAVTVAVYTKVVSVRLRYIQEMITFDRFICFKVGDINEQLNLRRLMLTRASSLTWRS